MGWMDQDLIQRPDAKDDSKPPDIGFFFLFCYNYCRLIGATVGSVAGMAAAWILYYLVTGQPLKSEVATAVVCGIGGLVGCAAGLGIVVAAANLILALISVMGRAASASKDRARSEFTQDD